LTDAGLFLMQVIHWQRLKSIYEGALPRGQKLQVPSTNLQSRDPRRGLMKDETPIGGFHNRLQSSGFQREFLKYNQPSKTKTAKRRFSSSKVPLGWI
jgi:hypothetical protein